MTSAQKILKELNKEAIATRKLLEKVPKESSDWKPHEKSMTLGRLATHVAEIPGWVKTTLMQDELDFQKDKYDPPVINDAQDLVALLDKKLSEAEGILNEFPDNQMQDDWTMRNGEQIYSTAPKEQVLRHWCMNHWYHHRAQLGVYLRLLEVPLPGTYGPSADGM